MSDLHLEMHRDDGVGFIDSLDPTGVDVLVLAGDIFSIYHGREQAEMVLNAFGDKYPHVVFVAGNHEHYGGTPTKTIEIINEIALEAGVDFLDNSNVFNSSVEIMGQRFIGGTGWFPDCVYNDKYKQYMNDFRIIKDFEPWVYKQHEALDVLLHGELLESDIVVTHHLPSIQCIAPQYKLSPLNAFFLSEFDDLILEKKPKLWLHGHTHTQVDLKIGPTRIVCNPHGYISEGYSLNAFQYKLLIEV
jgi:Icc-related predicted phosphoesterase